MERYFCPKPWENILIDVNGACYFCCFIDLQWGRLGNIKEQPFIELWHSKRAARIRRKIAAGSLPYACRKCAIISSKERLLFKVYDFLNIRILVRIQRMLGKSRQISSQLLPQMQMRARKK